MDGVEAIEKIASQRHDRASYIPTFVDQLPNESATRGGAVSAVSLSFYQAESVMPALT